MKARILVGCLGLFAGCSAGGASSVELVQSVSETPNVVVVFVDDLGWGDLGCYGAEALASGESISPNLDALAASGARLTRFYVSQPVCSASRASLLTGCYANRVGIAGALGPGSRHGLAPEETTLAELCAAMGYRTACFGKWHLGHHAKFLPTRQGFDEFAGIPYSNDMWPYHPQSPAAWPPLPWIEGERTVDWLDDQSEITEELTARSVDFLERCAAADEPFLLYLAHPQPHVPLFPGEAFDGKTGQGRYRDVVQELDASVGRVVAALEQNGLRDNTLVLFASDNGPWLSYGDHAGSTGGLREGKGTTFEGGVRVPGIVSWPGRLQAGLVVEEPLMTIDVLPTVARLIGAELPERPIDGEDVWPVIAEGASHSDRTYGFWYHDNQLEAVLRGQDKLHFEHGYRSMVGGVAGQGGFEGGYNWGAQTERALFDLVSDPGESVPLERPAVLRDLEEQAELLRESLGDRLRDRAGSDVREVGRVASGRFVDLPLELDLEAWDGELDAVWRSLVDRRRVPFVSETRVLLLWRGEAERVEALGVLQPIGKGAEPGLALERLGETDLWWAQIELPRNASRTYAYRIDGGEPVSDPANARSGQPWTEEGRSVLWMPDWKVSRFAYSRPMVERAQRLEVDGTVLRVGRRGSSPERFVFAGSDEPGRLGGLVASAENLAASGRIPSMEIRLAGGDSDLGPQAPESCAVYGVGGLYVAEALERTHRVANTIAVHLPSSAALEKFRALEPVDLSDSHAFVGAARNASEQDRARELAGWFEAAGATVTLWIDDADAGDLLLAHRAVGVLEALASGTSR